MDNERPQQPDDFEADVEETIEDKREAVIAADATGMVASEVRPVPVEDGAADVP